MLGSSGTAAVLLLSLSAPAGAYQATDRQIAQEVQRQVLAYPEFTIFDRVHAEVDDGVVTLRGKVTRAHKRRDLVDRVGTIPGVRAVHDGVEVLPVSAHDDNLRARLARAIYGNPAFRPYAAMANPPIHIIVEHGRVTLEGVVQSRVDRSLAESLAGTVDAVSLRNELRTPAGGAR